MDYARSKPKFPRPLGMGAFFDYGLAVKRLYASERASRWRKQTLPVPQPQQGAEERWDGEGGNSQTGSRGAQPARRADAGRRAKMNWDRIEGNWKQFKGNAKEEWSALTEEQLDTIAGRRDELVGRIQEAYGMSKAETEKQIADWQSRQHDAQAP
jgi:uncharacterized protein YjbJ (UPF0337 family)